MRTGRVTDTRTGRTHEIRLDAEPDRIWIDGEQAARMGPLEDEEGEWVCGIDAGIGTGAMTLFRFRSDDMLRLPEVPHGA
jgi:hypothetical protein